jgi:hypothetical protein
MDLILSSVMVTLSQEVKSGIFELSVTAICTAPVGRIFHSENVIIENVGLPFCEFELMKSEKYSYSKAIQGHGGL